MKRTDLLQYARLGVQARIDSLQSELDELMRQFPGIKPSRQGGGTTRRSIAKDDGARDAGTTAAPAKRAKRQMSAAGRKRIGDAARKRWAAWRKANGEK